MSTWGLPAAGTTRICGTGHGDSSARLPRPIPLCGEAALVFPLPAACAWPPLLEASAKSRRGPLLETCESSEPLGQACIPGWAPRWQAPCPPHPLVQAAGVGLPGPESSRQASSQGSFPDGTPRQVYSSLATNRGHPEREVGGQGACPLFLHPPRAFLASVSAGRGCT